MKSKLKTSLKPAEINLSPNSAPPAKGKAEFKRRSPDMVKITVSVLPEQYEALKTYKMVNDEGESFTSPGEAAKLLLWHVLADLKAFNKRMLVVGDWVRALKLKWNPDSATDPTFTWVDGYRLKACWNSGLPVPKDLRYLIKHTPAGKLALSCHKAGPVLNN